MNCHSAMSPPDLADVDYALFCAVDCAVHTDGLRQQNCFNFAAGTLISIKFAIDHGKIVRIRAMRLGTPGDCRCVAGSDQKGG